MTSLSLSSTKVLYMNILNNIDACNYCLMSINYKYKPTFTWIRVILCCETSNNDANIEDLKAIHLLIHLPTSTIPANTTKIPQRNFQCFLLLQSWWYTFLTCSSVSSCVPELSIICVALAHFSASGSCEFILFIASSSL